MDDFCEMAYLAPKQNNNLSKDKIISLVKNNEFTIVQLMNYLGAESEEIIWTMLGEGELKLKLDFRVTT